MLNSLRLNHQSVELFFVIACCLIDSCCNCCNYCSYCSCYSYCNHSSCSYYNYYSYMKYLHDLDSVTFPSVVVVTFSIDCVSVAIWIRVVWIVPIIILFCCLCVMVCKCESSDSCSCNCSCSDFFIVKYPPKNLNN